MSSCARRRYSGRVRAALPGAAGVGGVVDAAGRDRRLPGACTSCVSCSNHGIIGLQPAFVWRTIEGGSQNYVAAMTATFAHDVRLSTPVRGVDARSGWRDGCLDER